MQMLLQPQTYGFKLGNSEQARSIGFQEERSPTLNAECGGNKPAIVCLATQQGGAECRTDDKAPTLTAAAGMSGNNQPVCCYDMTHANDVIRECGETAPTLQSRMGTGGNQIPLTYQQVTGPLMANSHPGSYAGQDAYTDMFPSDGYAVRRLTPLECERLQGFPDGWTDIGAWTDSNGKLHKESSDSARYKALGNSIALPPWKWVLKRLCAFYERDATMASLFDGIGGFPLIWEQLNGKGTCLWASEIEEFPIAVTKLRFGEVSP
jgi:site-specific DNA-cytosine methylase